MELKVSHCFIAVHDHPEALAFYRDVLGLEVRNDTKDEGMPWVTVGPKVQPDVNIVLERATANPNAPPARPRAAAPRPRPDRPGVRAAAGRRGARPRRAHVGRAPQPRVSPGLRRIAVQLPDDAAYRAGNGAAASWRPQRHRGLLRGRLLFAGHLQQSLHRTGRYAAQHLPAPRGERDGGDAAARGETGDPTDQESRNAGQRAATSMTAMDLTIHATFLPHDDADASLAFYRDTLGFEVRNQVGYAGKRWITVGPAGQPGTSIVLHPAAVGPGSVTH